MKTTRRIKILLTTTEVLVQGPNPEKTNDEEGLTACPVCHSPLPASRALVSAVTALTGSNAEAVPEQNESETKNIKEEGK